MNYEKAYKEALERAREFQKSKDGLCVLTAESIFPELKESEDEKVRKALIELFTATKKKDWRNIPTEKIIAWLEKQGEKKATDKVEPKFKVGDIIINIHYRWDGKHRIREITDGKYIFDSGSYIDIKEQNSWELADKVEPKFHEGDLIIDKQGIVHQIEKVIENVTNNTFAYDLVGGGYFNEEVKSCRLWTIEDAKDGDVLYSLDSKQPFIFKHRKPNEQAEAYCGLNIYGKFFVWGTKDCVITLSNYIPATKEQRDTLLKAMADAGYTFDFEKKELKLLISNGGDF